MMVHVEVCYYCIKFAFTTSFIFVTTAFYLCLLLHFKTRLLLHFRSVTTAF